MRIVVLLAALTASLGGFLPLDQQCFICLNSYYRNKEVLNEFIKENENLVSAILSRDTKTAVELTQISWESSVRLITDAMQKNVIAK